MPKRLYLLLAVLLLVGVMTHAFAQDSTPQTISRAGAVALLIEGDPFLKNRFTQIAGHMPPLFLFRDVTQDQWYAPYIETAFEAGIITGNVTQVFRPGDAVTEEEAITFAARIHARRDPTAVQILLASATAQNWFDAPLLVSSKGGLTLPQPVQLGTPMKRDAYYALLTSLGIAEPRALKVQSPPPVISPPAPTPLVVSTAAPTVTRATVTPQPARTPTPTPVTRTPIATPTIARTTPTSSVAPSQKSFAISMPSLGITDLTVTHPADPSTKDGLLAPLKYGVGHLFSYPGQGGNILVYGHSSSYSWDVSSYTKIFRQINQLAVGDTIYVTYAGKQYTYRVTYKQTVLASDMSVYQRGSGEELILYTCWPPDSIKERYLVHASPVN